MCTAEEIYILNTEKSNLNRKENIKLLKHSTDEKAIKTSLERSFLEVRFRLLAAKQDSFVLNI
jgi:hypothetical protein